MVLPATGVGSQPDLECEPGARAEVGLDPAELHSHVSDRGGSKSFKKALLGHWSQAYENGDDVSRQARQCETVRKLACTRDTLCIYKHVAAMGSDADCLPGGRSTCKAVIVQ